MLRLWFGFIVKIFVIEKLIGEVLLIVVFFVLGLNLGMLLLVFMICILIGMDDVCLKFFLFIVIM